MGYKGPNAIFEDFIEMEWTAFYVIQVLYPEDETVTHGSPYNLYVLNSPETGHLGKMIISTNW